MGEFDTTFTYTTVIGYEPGVTRRDPSPVIFADGLYHVWYSKATVDPSGFYASVYRATSPDGWEWTERGEAIPKGPDGDWDANGVYTPTTLIAEGKYWLVYTAVPKPFNPDGGPSGTPTAIGIASAETPDGPWTKFEGNPILRPGAGDAWDSHRVDDSCMLVRDGKYRLYFKGRQKGLSWKTTKMGLAVADQPTGPYVKHPANPIIGSGHEVCVWPHREGVASLMAPIGPEGSTVQYAEDGIHFTVQSRVEPPKAPGPFRADAYRDVDWGPGITWGICHTQRGRDRPFLLRFDCDLAAPKRP